MKQTSGQQTGMQTWKVTARHLMQQLLTVDAHGSHTGA